MRKRLLGLVGLAIAACFEFAAIDPAWSQVRVRSYVKKDGTRVRAHTRSSPSSRGIGVPYTPSSSGGISSPDYFGYQPLVGPTGYRRIRRRISSNETIDVYSPDQCGLTNTQIRQIAAGLPVAVRSGDCLMQFNAPYHR